MELEKTPHYSIKIITVGNAYSGKTSITNVFCGLPYHKLYDPTIGVEFNSTTVFDNNDDKYKLMFWDTAGQETFAPIIKSYYKNIAGMIIVIDLSDSNGLTKLDYWLNEFKKNKSRECETKIIVLGNKCDLKRKISKEKIEDAIKSRNLDYFEVSAKKNLNIQKSIMKLFNSIISEFDRETHPAFSDLNKKFTYQEKKEKETEKYKCCITC